MFLFYLQELADLKRENFSLKLRIHELEKHQQQTSADSTEDVFQTGVDQELHTLLREKEMELVQIRDQHLSKVLEVQRLQLDLKKKEQQLTDLMEKNEQLEKELEDLQQQRRKDCEAVKEFTVQMRTLQDRTKDVEVN
ncbi:CDK5 regulatory subunit-associated protein 2-like [Thalassophryne amazonica]|uniref:CDK5 regulatory subunit-associated protein 2-like n=1 Tax=Thalassophryne amazonica TaxID=390379 RepID=UPI001470F835|nr:CDK5 regulatory subunit-associated protein 2-like [Thalassophryne amazonica]